MIDVWFMYDRHVFVRVGDSSTSREHMLARSKALFAEDGCGSLFAKNSRGRVISPYLGGKPMADGKHGVTDVDIAHFFDRVDEYANWQARG